MINVCEGFFFIIRVLCVVCRTVFPSWLQFLLILFLVLLFGLLAILFHVTTSLLMVYDAFVRILPLSFFSKESKLFTLDVNNIHK